ncbi:MAG: hypothetical protein KF833_00880 [Verrucomicrobiae bacterium]|nr:hypothetical protein [Verrucomicrobiae bacterium]
MNTRSFLRFVLSSFALATATTPRSALAAASEEVRLVAELIWGTNGPKPDDVELRPIAPELEKRLRRIFKWRSYYEIERKPVVTRAPKPTQVQMSKECRLEILHLGGHEFEIQLFGKGVLVVKKRQRIVPGETVVLGGDDKNDDAWFVVLSLARPGTDRRG